MRRVRRWLGLDEPQETRFFLFIAAWAFGAGTIYWFVSYEVAGTAMLVGLGFASGAVALRLILVRRAATVRERAGAEAEAHADGSGPVASDREGVRVVTSGAGAGGIDRPFDDPRGLIPDPTVAPFAVGIGAAIAATGLVFGWAPIAVGLLPLGWGMLSWLGAARDELDTTVHIDAVEAGTAAADDHR